MIQGYIIVEGMRVGACLDGLQLRLLKVERSSMQSTAPTQPTVWTTVEFGFDPADAERVAAALSALISSEGGWYTNFTVDEEVWIIFADRIFRYQRGDGNRRAEVEDYARSVGIPDSQLDWDE
jgi:hypothetical protein